MKRFITTTILTLLLCFLPIGATGQGTTDHVYLPGSSGPGASGYAGANVVYFNRVYIDRSVSVNKVAFKINSGPVGALFSAGLYTDDGNTLLIDSTPIAATPGVKTSTLLLTVPISPGYYLQAYTGNASYVVYGAVAIPENAVFNAVMANTGQAANGSVNGQLPATLGTLTASPRGTIVMLLSN